MTIEIMALADHEWAVQVQESQGSDVTYHKVRVEPETTTTLGVSDEGLLVREAVETYLEHGPATALPHDLTLDWLEHNVPGFLDDLTSRLS
ncbi:MAG TPA: hypothetical protein VHE57_16110 [Mycobacteriales bacterium]|nr:hypothetical protein [Mycobacteriales bacterium]